MEGPQVCEPHEASGCPRRRPPRAPSPATPSLHRRTTGEEEEDLEGEPEGETRQSAGCSSSSGGCSRYGRSADRGKLRLLSCLRGCWRQDDRVALRGKAYLYICHRSVSCFPPSPPVVNLYKLISQRVTMIRCPFCAVHVIELSIYMLDRCLDGMTNNGNLMCAVHQCTVSCTYLFM